MQDLNGPSLNMKINIDLKKILHISGKPDEENSMIIDKFFSLSARKLADIGVNVLKNTKITPNQITITRAIIFVPLIIYFFSRGTHLGNILAFFLSGLNMVCDLLDGNLARAKLLTSKTGAWLDHNLDKITLYLIFIGIIWGSYKSTQNDIFFAVGIFVLFLHSMLINICNDYDAMFGEDLFFNLSLKEDVCRNKKSTLFDKVLVNIFIIHSFWTYLFLAVRYQLIIGAILNIMPYMIIYWSVIFFGRWVFLSLIYLSLLKKEKSQCVFINELKKRALVLP